MLATQAPSTTPDPGWCGDRSRGASMGRGSYGQPSGRCYLRRVRIDSGGYDPGGAYWGIGAPLYECFDADGEFYATTRAADRTDAKRKLTERFPAIGFKR